MSRLPAGEWSALEWESSGGRIASAPLRQAPACGTGTDGRAP
ncbi:MAG: hypothetical protein F4118_10240 [Acidimicrobiaceae bacterium]|nr:hypothetical protein [Acidimicrobiaceae bacterium]MYB86829.1 hypothetical protein [Acidimicrobiaceae bacterium]MYI36788.1 hypothetical protein [Acidimicrobiaceae bacterium]